MKAIEPVLTPIRYRHGGWESFLRSVAAVSLPGDRITIRLQGFDNKEETKAIRALHDMAGLSIELRVKNLLFRRRFFYYDEVIDAAQIGHGRPDALIILEVTA